MDAENVIKTTKGAEREEKRRDRSDEQKKKEKNGVN